MSKNVDYNCLVVLGPTASGKTRVACQLAYSLSGEIISADSRQVYKHLDIGTGKDLDEYLVNAKDISYHLIDIREPGEQFFLHEFMELCLRAFETIRTHNKLPIICGGTGLYLDSLRKDFSLTQIKENPELRSRLVLLAKEHLIELLKKYPAEHTAHVDLHSKKRIIRAIEVAEFLKVNPQLSNQQASPYSPFYIGLNVPIDERKEKITKRLQQRLNHGLVEETEKLLHLGVSAERLEYLGLEYKFTTMFVKGFITREELFTRLQTAIFQYAKRQMTWFRKMEKEGVKINWILPGEPIENILSIIPAKLREITGS